MFYGVWICGSGVYPGFGLEDSGFQGFRFVEGVETSRQRVSWLRLFRIQVL